MIFPWTVDGLLFKTRFELWINKFIYFYLYTIMYRNELRDLELSLNFTMGTLEIYIL